MSEYEFTISLRIRHPGVDPSSITQALAIEPQHTWRAGERRRGRPASSSRAYIVKATGWEG